MMTALQEREHKFLEMIEDMILDEFGEDNHLYPAFDLAFIAAAYNIQNDVKLTLADYLKKDYEQYVLRMDKTIKEMKLGGKL